MSTKEPDKNKAPEDKDYGFPFVEVTPLAEASSKEKKKQGETHESESSGKAFDAIKPTVGKGLISPTNPSQKRPKRQSPVLFSLVLLIVVVLGVMAYFLYYLPTTEDAGLQQRVAQENTTPVTEEPPLTEDEGVDEDEEIANEEEEPNEPEDLEETQSPMPATSGGNTPATLQVIPASGDRPVYHIIVGSMPNERLARTEAEKLLKKGKDLYLLTPKGETKNYRISVGSYSTFREASVALEEAKPEFDESIWILKY